MKADTFNFAPGGADEAVIRLGISASDNPNWLGCTDRIDAATYSPAADVGHIVTVTLEDTSGNADFTVGPTPICGILGHEFCDYTTTGTVGCVGQNYTLNFIYTIPGYPDCIDTLVVTTGDHEWSKTTTCHCGTIENNTVTVTLKNDPGFLGRGTGLVHSALVVNGGFDSCPCTTDADCPNTDLERCNLTTLLCEAVGACCDTLNGDCSEGTLESDCVGDQRIWTRDETCGGMEACCNSVTGSCYMADRTCCVANGDTPNGPGSVCTATAACCLSGTCRVLDPLCCIVQGGVPQAAGTTCGECGSCCLADKDCLDDLVDSTCLAVGGSFNGAGSFCVGDSDGDGIDDLCDNCHGVDDAVFGPKTCDSGRLCETDADCVGDGTCIKACLRAIPTVSEWALVVLTLLLLTGAKIYFARRKTARA